MQTLALFDFHSFHFPMLSFALNCYNNIVATQGNSKTYTNVIKYEEKSIKCDHVSSNIQKAARKLCVFKWVGNKIFCKTLICPDLRP